MSEPRPRVAVTGVGIISGLGATAGATFARLLTGDRGFRPPTLFDASAFCQPVVAEVNDFRVADVAPAGEEWGRVDALSVVAAREALRDAGLERDPHPVSIALGTTTGGMLEAEGVLVETGCSGPLDAAVRRLTSLPVSSPARHVARLPASVAEIVTLCSACSSGAAALVLGASWLSSGRCRRVLAGGAESLCLLTFAGFHALGATDPGACRPFDEHRAGLTLGEGAAFLVLESEEEARHRDARVLAWLTGWALGAEAHHATQPEPSGATAARWISEAIARARLQVSDIDYVNAHGTGTPLNDSMEARALAAVFGPELERVLVSSSKGQLGHTLGAAGALEAVISVLSLQQGVVPPTAGLEKPDPGLPKLCHVLARGRTRPLRAVLSNSFGFGGTGSVLLFESAAAPPRLGRGVSRSSIVVTSATIEGSCGAAITPEECSWQSRVDTARAHVLRPLPEDALAALDPERSRRFDRQAALVTGGVQHVLEGSGLDPGRVGLASGSGFVSAERSAEFSRRVLLRGPRGASPVEFPRLVPSASSASASIYHGLRGPVVTVNDLTAGAESALGVGLAFLELGLADAVIAGGLSSTDAVVRRVNQPPPGTPRLADGEGGAWLLLEQAALAHSRNARILAELSYHGSALGLPEDLPPPSVPERAVAFLAHPAPSEPLQGTGWDHALEIRCSPPGGPLTLGGGMVLALAVSLVGAGYVTEALTWSEWEGRTWVAIFRSVPPNDPVTP